MNKRRDGLTSIVLLVLLLMMAIFAAPVFFNRVDSRREKRVIKTPKETITANVENDGNERDRLEQAMRLIDQVGSKNILAIQKKQLTDSERKGLQLELNDLHDAGLIHGIWLTALSDYLVYVAYYNVVNSDSKDSNIETLSIKEYKFSDYATFEYSFWVDSKSGKIYEVMLIDDNEDFSLSERQYMNGVGKYYGIDYINPLEKTANAQIMRYQMSLNDYQTTSYYVEYSIYHPSEGSFITSESGMNWGILSQSLKDK